MARAVAVGVNGFLRRNANLGTALTGVYVMHTTLQRAVLFDERCQRDTVASRSL